MGLFLGHDLGTSGAKAVLVDREGNVRGASVAAYPLSRPRDGWAEQEPADYWAAVVASTRAALAEAGASADDVEGLAFAGQMLALVPLDARGAPTRAAMSWLDGRAEVQARRLVRRLGGERVLHLLAGASPTGKDLIAKIAWMRDEEPEAYRRTRAFTDVTGYCVAQATGELRLDHTAAGCTGMLDARSRTWSRVLSALASFPLDKMPTLARSVDVVGPLRAEAAAGLGLRAGTPVVMGMADIPAAAVGSGAVAHGEAHVYLGTSAWIGVSLDRPGQDPSTGIASVPSADPGGFLMIGESETAGACRDWLASRLEVDDEGLESLVRASEPGARGLLFLPWLYGERTPVPDSALRGGFVGLSLEHERRHLARAVYEGVALNLRWTLEACARAGAPCPTLRAIGGGVQSDAWMQVLADVCARPVERVAHPRLAGAIGAALVAAVGVGALPSVRGLAAKVSVERRFDPSPGAPEAHARALEAMRGLAAPMGKASRALAGRRP